MKIVVYGKEHCPYCDKAKNILEQYGFSYAYYDINKDNIDLVTLTTKTAPGAKTVPIVIVQDVWIGGYTELEAFLKAWKQDIDKLRELLRNGETVSVVFVKSDGTTRIMHCTQNFDLIPPEKHPKSTSDKSKDPNLFTVFDVEKKDWRSFKADRIEKIV